MKVEIEVIVQMKMTYTINQSDGAALCPLEARLNPDFKPKEWTEKVTESITFYG